jgi:hypothetical protein
MQHNANEGNKKRPSAVQNLRVLSGSKAPQNCKKGNKRSRAKYTCNPNLAEMIRKANLLPPEFKLTSEPLKKTNPFALSELLTVIQKGEKVYLNFAAAELLRRGIEMYEFDNGSVDGKGIQSPINQIILNGNTLSVIVRDFKETAALAVTKEYGYTTKETKGIRKLAKALEQAGAISESGAIVINTDQFSELLYDFETVQELIETKDFLHSLIKLTKIIEFATKNNFISENANYLTLLNTIHSDFNTLSNHIVAQTWAEMNKGDLNFLPPSIKDGFVIEKATSWLLRGERPKSSIEKKDAVEFLRLWFESISSTLGYESKMDMDVVKSNFKTLLEMKREFTRSFQKLSAKVLATEVIWDKSGTINFKLSPYAELLQGVNVTRLRICEICSKFFWANREDTKTCSKLHAKTNRMRSLRKNWDEKRDQYLKARKKKKQKQI